MKKRNVGRPPMTEEQRAAKEKSIDIHLNIPENIINLVNSARKEAESRKDCIIRLINLGLQEKK